MALDLADKTGNGNTLTNVNTVAEETSSLPFAASTSAADFTAASTQYFSATDSTTLKPAGNFTVELWFNSAAVPGVGKQFTLFQSYSKNTNVAGIIIYISDSGFPLFESGKNTGTTGSDFGQVQWASNICDGNWHHLAFRYDGSNIIIREAGADQASAVWANAAAYAATNYVRIGAQVQTGAPVAGLYMNGDLDEIRLWDVARTTTEIDNNKSLELVGNETNLLAYWPFEALPAVATGRTGYPFFI